MVFFFFLVVLEIAVEKYVRSEVRASCTSQIPFAFLIFWSYLAWATVQKYTWSLRHTQQNGHTPSEL